MILLVCSTVMPPGYTMLLTAMQCTSDSLLGPWTELFILIDFSNIYNKELCDLIQVSAMWFDTFI